MTATANPRRVLAGPAVVVAFALLTVPLVAGALDSAFMTPLAFPGYLVLTIGSAVGNLLFPNFALWVYWVPFAMACYGIAVVAGIGYRAARGGG
ncbi:hypothetical protein [Haloglomus halophilum]|uniref:hypothetical protein n=1 Tax=Haloglomus halophilum TaxID=2962672 RepID=UPI0020C9AE32|nr:hypothetical protein [Haloglomus halophilum]